VIYEVMEINLHPTGRGARVFDPNTIEVAPRVASSDSR
jgi:hypothetical protein